MVLQRLAGLVLMGLLPFFLAWFFFGRDSGYLGWNFGNMDLVWRWFLVASVIILPLGFLGARGQANLSMYPQMRVQEWSPKLLLWSSLTWMLYLLGYETLFRGILFFPVLDHFGLIPAIALNVSIYSLAHIPKGRRETIGAIPAGIIFCMGSYYTGNIWFPFLAHSLMALSNEWFSIYLNPEMRLVRNQSSL